MGRTGVTPLDIEKAALQLQGRGKNPTVDSIREILGTGSKSTIAQHLRAWKTQQPNSQTNLPQDLLALVTGLWERLNTQAEQRILEIEATANQQSQETKQALHHIQQDYTQSKRQLHQLEEAYAAEQHARTAAAEKARLAEQEHAKLLERHHALSQQLEDYKTENARLHQLANNIQANLAHYQNAMQQLRTEQTLVAEKQQLQFQQEKADLQQQLLSSRAHLQTLEQQLQGKSHELQQLQAHQEAQEKLIEQLQNHSRELIIYKERHEQQQKNLENQGQALEQKQQQIIELEKQLAIVTEQSNRLQKSLSEAEDKIDALRHEKTVLAQEKAHLAGCLKQLEKVKSD